MIKGELLFDENKIKQKASLEITNTNWIKFKVKKYSKILIIEVKQNKL